MADMRVASVPTSECHVTEDRGMNMSRRMSVLIARKLDKNTAAPNPYAQSIVAIKFFISPNVVSLSAKCCAENLSCLLTS